MGWAKGRWSNPSILSCKDNYIGWFLPGCLGQERENRALASGLACDCAIPEARSKQIAKHVELRDEGLRTGVRIPPAPPYKTVDPDDVPSESTSGSLRSMLHFDARPQRVALTPRKPPSGGFLMRGRLCFGRLVASSDGDCARCVGEPMDAPLWRRADNP